MSEGSKAVMSIEEEIARDLAATKDTVGALSSNVISIKNSQFKLPGGEILTTPLKAYIIDYTSQNVLYPSGKYDPQNPAPADCFAINKVIKDMKPNPDSPEPQADNCEECPNNAWGSDGAGKACKNQRKLALAIPGKEELYTLILPPTAVTAFDKVVSSVASLYKCTMIQMEVTLDFHPERDYPCPIIVNTEPNENFRDLWKHREEAVQQLAIHPR